MNINREYLGCFDCARSMKPTAIVIHHTCTKTPKQTRSALQKRGLSTHFEVDVDGTVYQYTQTDKQCAHCNGANWHSIGIDVTHMANAPFPDVQVAAVRELVQFLCKELDIPLEIHETLSGVFPHRALCQTECPQAFPLSELK